MTSKKLCSIPICTAISLLAILLSGCATLQPKPAGLSNEQAGRVTETILRAMDAGDHAGFTQDFSEEMKTAFPETEFDKLRDLLANASGQYQSIGEPTLSNNGDYAIYSFPAQYEKEGVTVTLTFRIGGDKVEGLFFDSQNLRKALQ
jgi:hypothetical protein